MKFAPEWILPGGSRESYEKLISSTGGNGWQSNKWAYVNAIRWGITCAVIQNISGGIGFAFKQSGDAASWGVYWGANVALWGSIFAAATLTKMKQSTATKEIALASMNPPAAPSAPTKTVKTEKTTGKSVTTTTADEAP